MSVIDTDRVSRIGPFPVDMGQFAEKMRDDRIQQSRENAEVALRGFEEAAAEARVPAETLRKEGDSFDNLADSRQDHEGALRGAR